MNTNTLIVFASGVVLVVASLSVGLYYRYQSRRLVVGAVRAAVEQNPDLGADVVAALAQEARPPDADLRRGVLFLSVAIATVCLAFAIGRPEALRVLVGVAAFPALIGAAYLSFHLFAARRRSV